MTPRPRIARPPFPTASPTTSPLLRIEDVAKLWDVSTRFVWAQIAAGRLRPVRLSRRATRIEAEEVARFLAAHRPGLEPSP